MFSTSEEISLIQSLFEASQKPDWQSFATLLSHTTRAEQAWVRVHGAQTCLMLAQNAPTALADELLMGLRFDRLYSGEDLFETPPAPMRVLLLRAGAYRVELGLHKGTGATDFRPAEARLLQSLAPYVPLAFAVWSQKQEADKTLRLWKNAAQAFGVRQGLHGLERTEPVYRSACPKAVAAHFKLTVQEARLALHLCDGLSLRACAAALGWQENSARSCSKAIYSKLGVSGQSALVRLLLLSDLPLLSNLNPDQTDRA